MIYKLEKSEAQLLVNMLRNDIRNLQNKIEEKDHAASVVEAVTDSIEFRTKLCAYLDSKIEKDY